jgi:hypothetical protein
MMPTTITIPASLLKQGFGFCRVSGEVSCAVAAASACAMETSRRERRLRPESTGL